MFVFENLNTRIQTLFYVNTYEKLILNQFNWYMQGVCKNENVKKWYSKKKSQYL